MPTENCIPTINFTTWLTSDRVNQQWLVGCSIAILVQFAIFKFLYPYPNFMPPDSVSYIEAANKNQFINLWPIGYSRFLRLFSCFSSSHLLLVLFQYLLLQGCILYLLFTVQYWLQPGKWAFRLLLVLNLLNPLWQHISNFVSSDALFTALSVLWFTQLIWILFKPNKWLLIVHGFVVLSAFMVRYNALYYPVISMLVLFFSNAPGMHKKWGIVSIAALLLIFIGRTQYHYKKETGTVQFSAFSGWQLAANALYGYAHAPAIPADKVPIEFRELHTLVNRHTDSLRQVTYRPDAEIGIYYLWDNNAPLKAYMRQGFVQDTINSVLKRWAILSPLYARYGRYLIKQFPGQVWLYYIWPNIVRYYVPPTGFMGFYNLGSKTVAPVTAQWFGFTTITTRYNRNIITCVEYFPIVLAIINVLFICSFTGMVLIAGIKRSWRYGNGVLWWMFIIWLSNMLFSVCSAPIELRYQLFPLILTLTGSTILLVCIIKLQAHVLVLASARNSKVPDPAL